MKTHKDLDVWKKSITLVKEIYEFTSTFPKEELYGITSQLRRCAVSIPSNIAEGAARNHKKEFIQFLYISLGSVSELDTQIIICGELNFINNDQFNHIQKNIEDIRAMILGLINYLNNKT